jgi:hypothetical protein
MLRQLPFDRAKAQKFFDSTADLHSHSPPELAKSFARAMA